MRMTKYSDMWVWGLWYSLCSVNEKLRNYRIKSSMDVKAPLNCTTLYRWERQWLNGSQTCFHKKGLEAQQVNSCSRVRTWWPQAGLSFLSSPHQNENRGEDNQNASSHSSEAPTRSFHIHNDPVWCAGQVFIRAPVYRHEKRGSGPRSQSQNWNPFSTAFKVSKM